MSNPIQVIESDVYAMRERFEHINADPQHIVFQREAEFALQTLSRNEYAMKIAMASRQSVQDAISNVAAIGITLNPAKRQAYLVPRDGRICLDISYIGLIHLAASSGSIRWAQANIVRANDTFELRGIDMPPQHRFNAFSPVEVRGDVVGAYVTVKTADGDYLTHTMNIEAIHAIRNRSVAWQAWISKKRKCPWVTDEDEMAKKTVAKQASKYWPNASSGRLAEAIHHLNTEVGEGLAGKPLAQTEEMVSITEDALTDIAAQDDVSTLRDIASRWMKKAREANDKSAYASIQKAAKDRRDELSGVQDIQPVEQP